MFAFLIQNIDQILTILAAVHGVAVMITNLTPTPADDAAVYKAYRVIEILAGLITPKAKQAPINR